MYTIIKNKSNLQVSNYFQKDWEIFLDNYFIFFKIKLDKAKHNIISTI